MNTNGRLVVPEPIRNAYGIKRGDLVEIEVHPVEGDVDD